MTLKRKIAAIMAADIAGYSKLVAEDEEETLRRLASYRTVFDEFIAKAGGKIFNTAGDAVMAEFTSAVEAVRCAIDIQESLRTRNLAYPPSRQMNFRIGITVGDVVDHEGDLLGDGVNIAARLEGIAPVAGICISRSVYEQVANKLSVQFTDIGEQQVKNIPSPVHAFTLMTRPDETVVAPGKKHPPKGNRLLTAITVSILAVVLAAIAYFVVIRTNSPEKTGNIAEHSPEAASSQGASKPRSADAPALSKSLTESQSEKLVPEAIPYIPDKGRLEIKNEYMPAPDHKAIAISIHGHYAFITGQPDAETAKAAALQSCQRAIDNSSWLKG